MTKLSLDQLSQFAALATELSAPGVEVRLPFLNGTLVATTNGYYNKLEFKEAQPEEDTDVFDQSEDGNFLMFDGYYNKLEFKEAQPEEDTDVDDFTIDQEPGTLDDLFTDVFDQSEDGNFLMLDARFVEEDEPEMTGAELLETVMERIENLQDEVSQDALLYLQLESLSDIVGAIVYEPINGNTAHFFFEGAEGLQQAIVMAEGAVTA